MSNLVPANDTAMPAANAPFTGLTTDHLYEIKEEMAFALDISARRPSTPDEMEVRRYLRATARYAAHLIKKRANAVQVTQ